MIQLFHGLNRLLLHSSDYGQSIYQIGTYPWCLSQAQCKQLKKPKILQNILVEMSTEVLQIKLGLKIY